MVNSSFKRKSKEETKETDNLHIPYSSEDESDDEVGNEYTGEPYLAVNHNLGSSTVIDESDQQDFYQWDRYEEIKPLPESVIKGLLNEEKIISKGIDGLIKIHSQVSKTGKSTKTLRHDLTQYFKSLGMLYQSLAELYDKETQRNSNILSTFNKWDHDKEQINDKLKEIRSDEREEGHKLVQLNNELISINNEIIEQEKRLKQLKENRKALKSEIIRTESVIESRSSPYIEELRNIESEEKRKIQELTDEKTIYSSNNNSQNFNISSLLSKFNNLNVNEKVNPNLVIETIARQVESFKDRTNTYRSQELVFQETSLIWENISDLLDQLEFDMQSTLTSNSNNESLIKIKIINILNQSYESLLSLQKSLNIENNPILQQLFNTEIGTIKQSLQILNPDFKTPSPSNSINTNFTINKNSIIPKQTSTNVSMNDINEIRPSLISSSGEISKSPPKDSLKQSLTKSSNKKDD